MMRLIALAPMCVFLALAGCGGGADGVGDTTPPPPGPANVAEISVDQGLSDGTFSTVNVPFVTLTICAPGSASNCQTIDHIEVDTGSYGLRVLSSVLSSSLGLAQETSSAGGSPIVECAVFADGFSWGPVKTADIQIAGETASAVPIQVIGDPAFPGIPNDCSSNGPSEDTVATFGANGILGVGPFIEDAGSYYTCAGGSCQAATISVGLQVSNPVAYFAVDNNGVIVDLPSIPAGGSGPVTGSLIFGIGTQSNNGLGSAKVYSLDPNYGVFTIDYNNQAYDFSFLDSGSTANYFTDSSIPTCASNSIAPGFFCPTSTLNLSAQIIGVNNATTTVNFSVANAQDVFNANPSGVLFDNIAAPNSSSDEFDFGLPFFFGRPVYTAIADQHTPAGAGPYFAF